MYDYKWITGCSEDSIIFIKYVGVPTTSLGKCAPQCPLPQSAKKSVHRTFCVTILFTDSAENIKDIFRFLMTTW
jgi:hypothetical protein